MTGFSVAENFMSRLLSCWRSIFLQLGLFLTLICSFCPVFKQPRGPAKRHPPIRANTVDEAIGKMLERKKISSKINYDVLKDLNIKPSGSPARVTASPKKEETVRKVTGRNNKPARTALSLSTPLSTLGKRWVHRKLHTWRHRSTCMKGVKMKHKFCFSFCFFLF